MIRTIQQNKKIYLIVMASLILIASSIISSGALSAIAFIILSIAVLMLHSSETLIILFALLPFANIFKFTPTSISFFTMLEIFVTVVFLMKDLLKNQKIQARLLSLFILFTYIILLSLNDFQFFKIIKAFVGFMLIYYATVYIKKEDIKNIAYVLSISVGLMLLLCQIPSYAENVQPFFKDLNYYIDSSSGSVTDIMRNSGFLGDPNYCAVLIIITLALLCVLYYYKHIGVEFWIFTGVLAPLGFLTYSKSYFLCIAALAIFLILFVLFPKHKGWAMLSILGVCVLIYSLFSGQIEVFNMILNRFSGNNLTTGRDTLNEIYLTYIGENTKVLLFGEGITVDQFSGAYNNVHNVYIELLFKMGIIGSIIYISTLILILKRPKKSAVTKRHFVDFAPALFMVIMFGFLSGILYYATPFYLIIAYAAFNYNSFEENNLNKVS